MNFIDIIKKRHATKKFDGKSISQDKLDQLFEMIRYAPSSVGLQQFKIKVISDQEIKEKLKAVSYNQEQITSCSHLLVFCAYTNFAERLNSYKNMMETKGIPQENIAGFEKMVGGYLGLVTDDYAPQWAARQAYIALDHAMLGAMSLGIDSCPMEGFDPAKYSEILALPKDIIPVVLCPLGYAADELKGKIRFPNEELFF